MRHNPVGKNESNPDPFEVSKMEWKTFEECIDCIRPYNLEKKSLITNIHNCIKKYGFYLS